MKSDTYDARMFATGMLIVAFLVLPFAAGLIFGAGVGWLVFGLLLLVGAFRVLHVADRKEKNPDERA